MEKTNNSASTVARSDRITKPDYKLQKRHFLGADKFMTISQTGDRHQYSGIRRCTHMSPSAQPAGSVNTLFYSRSDRDIVKRRGISPAGKTSSCQAGEEGGITTRYGFCAATDYKGNDSCVTASRQTAASAHCSLSNGYKWGFPT